MRAAMRALVVSLFALSAAFASDRSSAERTWNNVTYLGGAPGVRVNRLEPNQILTVTSEKIIVKSKPVVPPGPEYQNREPKLLFEIPTDRVIAVTHSGFRHDMHGMQRNLGLPGGWPKSTDYLVIVGYRLADAREAEVLLRVHKDSYTEIVGALDAIAAPK